MRIIDSMQLSKTTAKKFIWREMINLDKTFFRNINWNPKEKEGPRYMQSKRI